MLLGCVQEKQILPPVLLFFRLVAEALAALGVASSKEPDPGTWTVQQVSFWLSSCEVSLLGSDLMVHVLARATCAWLVQGIECRSEYSQKFSEAGVDGLHLLELSSAEMTGMCVQMFQLLYHVFFAIFVLYRYRCKVCLPPEKIDDPH